MRIKGIIVVAVLLALGWSGYWGVSAYFRKQATETWFTDRVADGWVAEYDDLTVRGFPSRIDTVFTNLTLADPNSGWAWSTARFELLTLSYKPLEIIAVWPGQQTISTPYDTVSITGDVLRASLAVSGDGAFTLKRARIEGANVEVEGTRWSTRLGTIAAATTALDNPNDGTAHRIGLTLSDTLISDDLRAQFDSAGILPNVAESVHLDANVTFGAPLSLRSVERTLPPLNVLNIADASAVWGELDLRAQGDLTADEQGFAQGSMTVRARGWRDMINLAQNNGMISSGNAQAITFGLGFLANAGGDPNTLSAPLTFANGNTQLGPITLGDAPRLQRK